MVEWWTNYLEVIILALVSLLARAEVVLPSGHHIEQLNIHVEEKLFRHKKTDVKNV